MPADRVFAMPLASVYPLYVNKLERKGVEQPEEKLVACIVWLTGYTRAQVQRALERSEDLASFFGHAPRFNERARNITGVICGQRVEEIADPLMQRIRYLDKLVDELARGKSLAKVLER